MQKITDNVYAETGFQGCNPGHGDFPVVGDAYDLNVREFSQDIAYNFSINNGVIHHKHS